MCTHSPSAPAEMDILVNDGGVFSMDGLVDQAEAAVAGRERQASRAF
jgi:hypothetical protein